MTTFLISFFAFEAVMLIILLLYGVWVYFFDRRNKAKKQHLQAIHNAVHWAGQSRSSAQESALETWLRTRSKTFKQLENLVQRARSPLTALRLMGLMLALFTVVVGLGLLRQTNLLLLLLLAVAITSTPLLWLFRQANQRHKAFEFPDPIGSEFKTVFDEIGFGIPFKEAIGHLADRVPSSDLNFFVISLMIQHETGGNLAELLDGLAKTMRERVKLRGKIRTLSAEGRISAWVLGSMPFVVAGLITLTTPGYLSVLWTTPQGKNLILIGSGLMAVGFFVFNRIIQIKV